MGHLVAVRRRWGCVGCMAGGRGLSLPGRGLSCLRSRESGNTQAGQKARGNQSARTQKPASPETGKAGCTHVMRQKPAGKGRTLHKSALTSFHAGVLLVDDINPAATPYDTAIFIAHLGRFQAVSDFHGPLFSADAQELK